MLIMERGRVFVRLYSRLSIITVCLLRSQLPAAVPTVAGKVQLHVMDSVEGGAVADAYDAHFRQLLPEDGVEPFLSWLIQGAGGFIEEGPAGLGDEDSQEGDALLLAKTEDTAPVVYHIKAVCESAELRQLHEPVKLCFVKVIYFLYRIGVENSLTECAEGKVGPLGQEHEPVSLRTADVSGAVRPQAGERAEKRGLAAAAAAGYQEPLTAVQPEAEILQQYPAVGQSYCHIPDRQMLRLIGRSALFCEGGFGVGDLFQMVGKAGKTVGDSHQLSDAVIGVDEVAEGILYPAEGADSLHETAQLHGTAEIFRCAHDDRYDDGQLSVAVGVEVQQLRLSHEPAEVVHHQLIPLGEGEAFGGLAAVEGDALAVLPDTGHGETEISLVALLVEVQTDEALTNLVGQHCADDGVQQGEPEHIARKLNDSITDGDIESAGKIPQYHGEGTEGGELLQEAKQKLESDVYELVDVVLDTLIRVVHVAVVELQPVVGTLLQPAGEVFVGHPGTPAELQ